MSIHEGTPMPEGEPGRVPAEQQQPAAAAGPKSAAEPQDGPRKGFAEGPGLEIPRRFTTEGEEPFAGVEWETRTASIVNEKGETVFEQKDVEVPRSWSQTATNIVAQKYFRGQHGTTERERSVRQLVGRVVDAITRWGD